MTNLTRKYKGVIFDAFGTLLQIQQGTHPFRQILKLGIAQGRRPHPSDIRVLMTQSLGLEEAAKHFGIDIAPEQLQDLEQSLGAEVASIKAYPDGLEALHLLREAGIKVSVCSNLAKPYGAAVDRLLPDLDAYGLSFEVGAMKPEKAIYQATVEQMGLDLADCAMVGDSQRCDRDGPAAFGIKGHYLGRYGQGDFSDLATFARHLIEQNRS